MSPDRSPLPEPLLAWLARAEHEPVRVWEPDPPAAELACDAELVARLSEIARPIRGSRRVFVAGCPVIHHPSGRALAAACGRGWMAVRSGMPAGELGPAKALHPDLGAEWVELDPWTADVGLTRGIDMLRSHVARAFQLAERGA